jgi:hypothetical protein
MRVSNVAWIFLICLLLGGAGLGYVRQKLQINQLGLQKRGLEDKLRDLLVQNRQKQGELEKLLVPWKIDERVKEMNLGLGYPQPEQVIRLVDLPWPGTMKPGVAPNADAAANESARQ